MKRRLLAAGVGLMLAALASAGPAFADDQTANNSALTAQVKSVGVKPAASASAPVNANAPVCVLSSCSSSGGAQTSGGSASSSSDSGSTLDNGQSAESSAGAAQVGSADVDPAVGANAPVNANTPICILADCSSSGGTQTSGGSTATSDSGSTDTTGVQAAGDSIGAVQVGPVTVDPAVGANAPVNANLPVCVLSSCTTQVGSQASGTSAASTGGSGPTEGQGTQSSDNSVGAVQLGSAGVDPAVAANLPVNANAPVCVLADCASSGGNQTSGDSSAASSGSTGGGDAQSSTNSVVVAQATSVGVDPVSAASVPVNANAPVCVLASCSSSGGSQTAGSSSAASGAGSSGGSGGQSSDSSAGVLQAGAAGVDPAAALGVPVNTNAPICILADCTTTGVTQAGGGSTAGTGTGSTGGSSSQTSDGSAGVIQIGQAGVDPIVDIGVPINTNTPICVLATCDTGGGNQTPGCTTDCGPTPPGPPGPPPVPPGPPGPPPGPPNPPPVCTFVCAPSPTVPPATPEVPSTPETPSGPAAPPAGQPSSSPASPPALPTRTPRRAAAGGRKAPRTFTPTPGGGSKATAQGGPFGEQVSVQPVKRGTLPFTGFPLWLAALAGIGTLLLGGGVRRIGKAR